MHLGRPGAVVDLSAAAWRRLEDPEFPFVDHAFLAALESTAACTPESGWEPWTLTAWEGRELVGALVAYRKTNSFGEYIFDWDWARAYRRLGRRYYPNLTTAVPFTPATGPKLLATSDEARQLLVAGLEEQLARLGASSAHWLFTTEAEQARLVERGWLSRKSFQYHWHNRGYRSFDDFLRALSGKRRRQIQRERRQVAEAGVCCELLTGASITEALAGDVYEFYRDTTDRKGGLAYLSESFFRTVFRTMRDAVVLAVARDGGGHPVAAALAFRKGKRLYGRHWGAKSAYRNLHFELCYYQLIEYAIREGIEVFEAGAQGEHKLARGFLPVITTSAHLIAAADFRAAIARAIEHENALILDACASERAHGPYVSNE
jgi:predicted N-acyltransferase